MKRGAFKGNLVMHVCGQSGEQSSGAALGGNRADSGGGRSPQASHREPLEVSGRCAETCLRNRAGQGGNLDLQGQRRSESTLEAGPGLGSFCPCWAGGGALGDPSLMGNERGCECD